MKKADFFKLFPVIQKFAVLKNEREVSYDWSIRLGVRSLQGPTNSTSSTVGIRVMFYWSFGKVIAGLAYGSFDKKKYIFFIKLEKMLYTISHTMHTKR